MNESRAARYQRLRRRAQAAGMVSGAAMLALLIATGGARALADWTAASAAGWPTPLGGLVAVVLFVSCLVLLWELVLLPALFYLSVVVDRRYARGASTVSSMLAAHLPLTAVALASSL